VTPPSGADIDRLYSSPLERFTSARDALSRTLRQDGDRDAAAEVKKLRKPSVSAWALNQVTFSEPEAVERLIEAGQGLREAQQRLLEQGERGALREAVTREREAVEEVVALAEQHLREGGHPLGATVEGKLRDTAHAGALDDEVAGELRSGRLVHERVVSDLGLAGAQAPGQRPVRRHAPRPPRLSARETRKLEALRRRVEQAQRARDEARADLRDAEREAKEARHAAERAERKLERARAKAKEAIRRAEELEAEIESQ
jgi:hypothetical protein